MAGRQQLDGAWAARTWVEATPRPVLVDHGGLRVRRTTIDLLRGRPGYRPIALIIAASFLLVVALMPLPGSLVDLVESERFAGSASTGDAEFGAAVSAEQRIGAGDPDGPVSGRQIARGAMIMLGILFVAALLWGTEALPIGGTVALVAVLLLALGILPPNEAAKAFMNDAVFFILGILAVAVGVSKTGLDKRIGLLLLSRINSAGSFAFVFFPLFALCSAFLSAHALVALLTPVMLGVYKATCAAQGVRKDRVLAVFLLLGVCFAANVGGPGSPAAGARNAVMVGFLADAGVPIGFAEWMKYGLPLVPVLALTVGAYMYIRCKPRLAVQTVNPGEVVRREVAQLTRFSAKEALMALILVGLVIAWMTLHTTLGMGGATLAAMSAMFLFRIVVWDDIQKGVAFDVVGLYAAASAMAVGLGLTGAGLWLASETLNLLPGFMSEGNGLVLGVSIITGTVTNFMSDGATVSTLGPFALPMAELGDVSVWKVGLMVSFSSSFANVLVVGTPNNAMVFAMSKDPETGERLLSVFDFIKYGLPLTLLQMIVMWGWALFGYWSLFSWP